MTVGAMAAAIRAGHAIGRAMRIKKMAAFNVALWQLSAETVCLPS
ncbi:MAG TPA: hypothetical protein VL051_12535 [Burkholderiaceae bacterium]|nr:hypothetical protein [Burkholderiaceae bacterium]